MFMKLSLCLSSLCLALTSGDQGFNTFQSGSFFDSNFGSALSSHSSAPSSSSSGSYSSSSYSKPSPPKYSSTSSPVYKPAPPSYPAPAPAPAPSYSAPAPSYPAPAPSYPAPAPYKPEPSYAKPQPSYAEPSHNCSVQDEVVHAEVCTPGLDVQCGPVTLKGTKIGSRQKCVDITRTVCSEGVEEGSIEVCMIKYETKPATADASVPDVSFERMCDKQMVTVCKPQTHGYGYNKVTYQHCEEIAQETCYNKPVVNAKPTKVDVKLPEPKTECGPMRVMLPSVECEEITEQSCVTLPALESADVQAESCNVKLGQPECKPVDLVLPKQVCQEILYGHAHKAKPSSGGYN